MVCSLWVHIKFKEKVDFTIIGHIFFSGVKSRKAFFSSKMTSYSVAVPSHKPKGNFLLFGDQKSYSLSPKMQDTNIFINSDSGVEKWCIILTEWKNILAGKNTEGWIPKWPKQAKQIFFFLLSLPKSYWMLAKTCKPSHGFGKRM